MHDDGLWVNMTSTRGTLPATTARPRHPPSSADYPEPFMYTYCRDDDLPVLIRGAKNAAAGGRRHRRPPPERRLWAAGTDPTPRRYTIPPYGGPPSGSNRLAEARTNVEHKGTQLSAKTEKPADVAEDEDGADNLEDATTDIRTAVEPEIDANAVEIRSDDGTSADATARRARHAGGESCYARRSFFSSWCPSGFPDSSDGSCGSSTRSPAQATEARQAAVSYAQVLTSIDSNKVDENFNQVLDGSTGEFKDMYSKSSLRLRQLLIDNKATAHGVVVASGIESATKNKVVVLLFVDQTVANMNMPTPNRPQPDAIDDGVRRRALARKQSRAPMSHLRGAKITALGCAVAGAVVLAPSASASAQSFCAELGGDWNGQYCHASVPPSVKPSATSTWRCPATSSTTRSFTAT